MSGKAIIPAHQWTDTGDKMLVVRFVDRQHRSYNGFQHPQTVGEVVTAPDWNDKAECGGGIHGWPWGLWIGSGKYPDWSAIWQVYAIDPADIVLIEDANGSKVKFRTGKLVFLGDWQAATNYVLSGQVRWVYQASRGAASATGWRGAASATGERGAASATGERGTASATGWSGAAVITGTEGRAQAGPYGCIALCWWNEKKERGEMRCARIGRGDGKDKLLKAKTWYKLDKEGKFVEDKEANASHK